MKSPRDIIKVIDSLLAVIPDEEIALRSELERTRVSACYTPPDCMAIRWRRISAAFTDIPWPPQEEWQRKASAIIRDEKPAEATT